MLIKETLNAQDISNLFSGTPVGIFKNLFEQENPFYNLRYPMSMAYYTYRSANKRVSKTYTNILSYKELGADIDVNEQMTIIIKHKFIDKWTRLYNVLITSQYNPLDSVSITEQKNGNNTTEKNYNNSVTKTGNNSDTTTFDTELENNSDTNVNETTTSNNSDTNKVYGFNSVQPVNTDSSESNSTDTVTANKNDNTEHSIETKTGTETKNFTISETDAKSGTDTDEITIDESITKTGTDVAKQDLVNKELDLRNRTTFFDIVFTDIDSIMASQIY